MTLVTPWTIAHQAPLSMGFSRQEHWCVLPFLSLGDLPNPRVELTSPPLLADSLPLSHQRSPLFLHICIQHMYMFKSVFGIFFIDMFMKKVRVINSGNQVT